MRSPGRPREGREAPPLRLPANLALTTDADDASAATLPRQRHRCRALVLLSLLLDDDRIGLRRSSRVRGSPQTPRATVRPTLACFFVVWRFLLIK